MIKKNKKALIEAIQREVSSPVGEYLIEQIKPAVRLIPSDKKLKSRRNSKFGGLPALPASMEWPREETLAKPYSFLAQINLSELEVFDHHDVLPSCGMLYFFFNLSRWTEFLICFAVSNFSSRQGKKHSRSRSYGAYF